MVTNIFKIIESSVLNLFLYVDVASSFQSGVGTYLNNALVKKEEIYWWHAEGNMNNDIG